MMMISFEKEDDIEAPGVMVRGRWVCKVHNIQGAKGFGQTREEAASHAVRMAFEVLEQPDTGVM